MWVRIDDFTDPVPCEQQDDVVTSAARLVIVFRGNGCEPILLVRGRFMGGDGYGAPSG
jgi:hypothetical protein